MAYQRLKRSDKAGERGDKAGTRCSLQTAASRWLASLPRCLALFVRTFFGLAVTPPIGTSFDHLSHWTTSTSLLRLYILLSFYFGLLGPSILYFQLSDDNTSTCGTIIVFIAANLRARNKHAGHPSRHGTHQVTTTPPYPH